MTRKIGARVAVAVAALYSSAAMSGYQMNFTRGATRLTEGVYELHFLLMWIITVIFCAVFGVMFYAVYEHRKSVGHKAANFHENTMVEIAWTVVPFFILIAMTVPATKTMLEVRDASNPDITRLCKKPVFDQAFAPRCHDRSRAAGNVWYAPSVSDSGRIRKIGASMRPCGFGYCAYP